MGKPTAVRRVCISGRALACVANALATEIESFNRVATIYRGEHRDASAEACEEHAAYLRRLRLRILGDGAEAPALYRTDEGGDPFTLAEFERDNADAPVDVEPIRALAPGASVTLGGGACGETVVTRLTDIECADFKRAAGAVS